jgi:hypothetical protein
MLLGGASDELDSVDTSGPLLIGVGGCVYGGIAPSPASASFFDCISADVERCSIVVFREFGVGEMGIAPGDTVSWDCFELSVMVFPVDFCYAQWFAGEEITGGRAGVVEVGLTTSVGGSDDS